MAEPSMSSASIAALLDNMLAPKKGERMLFLTDYPSRPNVKAHGRQELLSRWHSAAIRLAQEKGFRVLPIARYAETGKNNADLPKTAVTHDGGHIDSLPGLIASSNIAIAMVAYSASAPLKNIAARSPSLRIVSMPGVTADMEPAMAVDYGKIEARGKRLLAVVSSSTGFEITFDGAGLPRNTRLFLDTRAANWQLDAGACRSPGDFINFPSGELFTPPYEGVSEAGRRELGDSKTEGTWPVYSHTDGKVAFLRVEKNRIVRVQGDSEAARRIIEDIASDENNANIAELGLGLNEKARSGAEIPILESEKSGPHIAYGRNDHFGNGGVVGVVKASVHQDIVYAAGSPIKATIYAIYPNGNRLLIAERGKVMV